MLFAAVSLGFLAENYREEQNEERQAVELAYSLYNDVYEDSIRIVDFKETKFRQMATYDSLRELLSTPNWKNRMDELYRMHTALMVRQSFSPREGTIQQLKNSGGLRYFKDTALVNRIEHYEAAKQVIRIRVDREQTLMFNFLDPLIIRFIDMDAIDRNQTFYGSIVGTPTNGDFRKLNPYPKNTRLLHENEFDPIYYQNIFSLLNVNRSTDSRVFAEVTINTAKELRAYLREKFGFK
jgi:hypothetical protein